jgi:3D (Asp-Asp-Asp) domain-containing protein
MKILMSLVLGLFLFFETAGNSSVPFTATAYALRGRTASGHFVSRGTVAADLRILSLGTKIKLDAGAYSGVYVVRDTGAKIRGKRIDIWMPSTSEARKFGRRKVHVTILK